jgi:hypothetical protein
LIDVFESIIFPQFLDQFGGIKNGGKNPFQLGQSERKVGLLRVHEVGGLGAKYFGDFI